MTQLHVLRNHLKAGKSITPLEARHVYGVEALPRRISDLKESGMNIKREMCRDECGKRYARYSLAG